MTGLGSLAFALIVLTAMLWRRRPLRADPAFVRREDT